MSFFGIRKKIKSHLLASNLSKKAKQILKETPNQQKQLQSAYNKHLAIKDYFYKSVNINNLFCQKHIDALTINREAIFLFYDKKSLIRYIIKYDFHIPTITHNLLKDYFSKTGSFNFRALEFKLEHMKKDNCYDELKSTYNSLNRLLLNDVYYSKLAFGFNKDNLEYIYKSRLPNAYIMSALLQIKRQQQKHEDVYLNKALLAFKELKEGLEFDKNLLIDVITLELQHNKKVLSNISNFSFHSDMVKKGNEIIQQAMQALQTLKAQTA